MKKNISTADRFIRVLLAVLFTMLMFNNYDDKLIRILTGILGAYCLLTAILEICMLYNLLKVTTRSSKRDKPFY